MPPDPLPVMAFESTDAWDAWLAAHHADSPGLWLKIAKKGSAGTSVSYSDALDVALCHGWIDGQKGRHDDDYWLQRFTPRKPGSNWSKINTERAAALIASGRMTPAGLREVEQAQADGRWERAYESQSRITVPEDLARALAANPRARDVLRHPRRHQPVRGPLPDRQRQAAGNPGEAHRHVCDDAQRAQEDPSLTPRGR